MKETAPETAVLFASLPPTPLDLRFRWFGVPTRVHPLFWLTTLLLGPKDLAGPDALAIIGIWMACVFFSILMHEWGHVLAYKFYRCTGTHITLEAWCGLAHADNAPSTHWRRIAVSLAGPGIQFVIAFLLWISTKIGDDPWYLTFLFPYGFFVYYFLLSINITWAIFNLLPIYPLDGGNVCREICYLLKLRKPLVTSLKFSLGTACVMIALGFIAIVQPSLISWIPSWFPIRSGLFCMLFMASLAYTSYMALKAVQHDPWGHNEDDREWWQRG